MPVAARCLSLLAGRRYVAKTETQLQQKLGEHWETQLQQYVAQKQRLAMQNAQMNAQPGQVPGQYPNMMQQPQPSNPTNPIVSNAHMPNMSNGSPANQQMQMQMQMQAAQRAHAQQKQQYVPPPLVFPSPLR